MYFVRKWLIQTQNYLKVTSIIELHFITQLQLEIFTLAPSSANNRRYQVADKID